VIRGILSATTAMRAQVLNQEVIANNLANADTVAYQKDKTVSRSFYDVFMYRFEPFSQTAIGGFTGGTVIHDIATLSATGPIEATENPLDIVLPEGTYLSVETPSGTRYTRMGNMEISDGYLTVSGYRVLGKNGPIQADGQGTYSITENGSVLGNGQEIGSLAVFSFSHGDSVLRKEGNTLFRAGNQAPLSIESPELVVGALEKSTVDPVSEMVNLISSLRAYEAAQKALHAHDETLEQAVNRVGRV
jgi:flagellar basal-body rod protein FlgF